MQCYQNQTKMYFHWTVGELNHLLVLNYEYSWLYPSRK